LDSSALELVHVGGVRAVGTACIWSTVGVDDGDDVFMLSIFFLFLLFSFFSFPPSFFIFYDTDFAGGGNNGVPVRSGVDV
jgi:hypothetical protein